MYIRILYEAETYESIMRDIDKIRKKVEYDFPPSLNTYLFQKYRMKKENIVQLLILKIKITIEKMYNNIVAPFTQMSQLNEARQKKTTKKTTKKTIEKTTKKTIEKTIEKTKSELWKFFKINIKWIIFLCLTFTVFYPFQDKKEIIIFWVVMSSCLFLYTYILTVAFKKNKILLAINHIGYIGVILLAFTVTIKLRRKISFVKALNLLKKWITKKESFLINAYVIFAPDNLISAIKNINRNIQKFKL